jgi:hypothetical protein
MSLENLSFRSNPRAFKVSIIAKLEVLVSDQLSKAVTSSHLDLSCLSAEGNMRLNPAHWHNPFQTVQQALQTRALVFTKSPLT